MEILLFKEASMNVHPTNTVQWPIEYYNFNTKEFIIGRHPLFQSEISYKKEKYYHFARAVLEEKIPKIEEALDPRNEKVIDVNQAANGSANIRFLHLAALSNNPLIAEILLVHRAEINSICSQDTTALDVAIKGFNDKTAAVLINRQAESALLEDDERLKRYRNNLGYKDLKSHLRLLQNLKQNAATMEGGLHKSIDAGIIAAMEKLEAKESLIYKTLAITGIGLLVGCNIAPIATFVCATVIVGFYIAAYEFRLFEAEHNPMKPIIRGLTDAIQYCKERYEAAISSGMESISDILWVNRRGSAQNIYNGVE